MKKLWMWFKDGYGMLLMLAIIVFSVRIDLELSHQLTIWLNVGSFLTVALFYNMYMVFGVYHRKAIKHIHWIWIIAASAFLFIFIWVFPWGDVTVPPSKNDIATCIGSAGLLLSVFSFVFAFMNYATSEEN